MSRVEFRNCMEFGIGLLTNLRNKNVCVLEGKITFFIAYFYYKIYYPSILCKK